MQKNKRKVLTICGRTTSGKSTLGDKLEETGIFEEIPSFTTRPPRPGEIDGKDYFFLTHEKAEEKIKSGDVLEYTEIKGNYYGSLKSGFEDAFDRGKIPMLVCDPVGPKMFKEKQNEMNWDVIPVFIDIDSKMMAERISERMISEQMFIKSLDESEPVEADKYREKYEKEYSSRLKNMGNIKDEQIDTVFQRINNYIESNNEKHLENIRKELSTSFDSEDSVEAKWKNDIKYNIVLSATDLEKDFDKSSNRLCNKILEKDKHNDFGISM